MLSANGRSIERLMGPALHPPASSYPIARPGHSRLSKPALPTFDVCLIPEVTQGGFAAKRREKQPTYSRNYLRLRPPDWVPTTLKSALAADEVVAKFARLAMTRPRTITAISWSANIARMADQWRRKFFGVKSSGLSMLVSELTSAEVIGQKAFDDVSCFTRYADQSFPTRWRDALCRANVGQLSFATRTSRWFELVSRIKRQHRWHAFRTNRRHLAASGNA
jgi:hypothetical protein